MKLALYQGPAADGDVEGAFARIEALLAASVAGGARMLLLPELFLPGYNRPDLHATLAEPLDGPWMTRVAELARAAGCGVTLGWAETAEGAVYNAATVFGPDGARLAHYRKIQLFGAQERASFTPGSRYVTFDLEGRRTGLLICYDVEFAPHVRALAERGAELVLVPTANPAIFPHVSDTLVPARAAENGVVVAYANYSGREAGLAYGGRSVIAGPDGQAIARAGAGEALLIVDLLFAGDVAVELVSTQIADARRGE